MRGDGDRAVDLAEEVDGDLAGTSKGGIETPGRQVAGLERRMLALGELGLDLLALGRFAEAADLLAESLAMRREMEVEASPDRAEVLAALGRALAAQGKRREAQQRVSEAEAVWRGLEAP